MRNNYHLASLPLKWGFARTGRKRHRRCPTAPSLPSVLHPWHIKAGQRARPSLGRQSPGRSTTLHAADAQDLFLDGQRPQGIRVNDLQEGGQSTSCFREARWTPDHDLQGGVNRAGSPYPLNCKIEIFPIIQMDRYITAEQGRRHNESTR